MFSETITGTNIGIYPTPIGHGNEDSKYWKEEQLFEIIVQGPYEETPLCEVTELDNVLVPKYGSTQLSMRVLVFLLHIAVVIVLRLILGI